MVDAEHMVIRQRILADFGELALRSDDLDEVLTEACRLVGRALDTDLAKVLEIEDDKEIPTLFVRAGVGWKPGVVGEVRLPMSELSSETYAIEAGAPLLMADIGHEDRFDIPSFMKEAGVKGVVNVPIFLPGGKAYGLLQVDSRDVWSPQAQDIEFLRTYATILGPVIDRLHKVHALRQADSRNAMLLRELQHRIKNNIAAITALIRMRMKKATSKKVRSELGVIGERVETLRLVHEQVYDAQNADQISLSSYITRLLEKLVALHADTPVRLEVQIDDVDVGSDTAIPLGLILNEFTTNSLKYAFEERAASDEALISVEARLCDGRIHLRISDNGKGFPSKAKKAKISSGTGMALIEGLSRQMGARTDWSSKQGTSLALDFSQGGRS